jgi:DNA-binding transcriptional regulator YdaS (Cro superfamily)
MEQHPSFPETPAAKAVRVLGGPVKAAAALNVERYQTVQSWVRNRVPAEYCLLIERATREKGEPVTCEELRPDMAWDVVRGQSDAGHSAQPKAA